MNYNAFLTIQWNGDKSALKTEFGIMYTVLSPWLSFKACFTMSKQVAKNIFQTNNNQLYIIA